MLLAFVSEVLKHSFLVDWFTRLPHHGLQDVRALRGHGSHMEVRFEVEDRPIPSDVLRLSPRDVALKSPGKSLGLV